LPALPQTPIDAFRGDTTYLGADHRRNERRTWVVAGICLATLIAQIVGGLAFHSVALVANGVHMSAHVASLTAAAVAYRVARAYAADHRFAFGAGKVGYLVSFANAVVLAVTALLIALESLHGLLDPTPVLYDQAILLAILGLGVNLVCIWLLRPGFAHAHDRDGDLNLSASHLHLTADGLISALAIAGLAAGRYLEWTWADPLAAMVGAVLVAQFAWNLLRRAGATLLDINPSAQLTAEVRGRLEAAGARILDLHLWRLGPGHHAAIIVLSQAVPLPVGDYHSRLSDLSGLSHVTIEIRPENKA
jgi:cation diffusion facilitator family transporter